MSLTDSHAEFMRTLPRTPLAQHIQELDLILLNLGILMSSPTALDVARHNLWEIAAYTSTPDWVRDGIRREVLDEFTQALKMVTAVDPNDPRRLT